MLRSLRSPGAVCGTSGSDLSAELKGSGHIAQPTEPADRIVQHLLLLAEGPAHVRPPRLNTVVEHLMGNRDHPAAAREVATELNTVAIAERPYVGGHEVRAARQDRLESD